VRPPNCFFQLYRTLPGKAIRRFSEKAIRAKRGGSTVWALRQRGAGVGKASTPKKTQTKKKRLRSHVPLKKDAVNRSLHLQKLRDGSVYLCNGEGRRWTTSRRESITSTLDSLLKKGSQDRKLNGGLSIWKPPRKNEEVKKRLTGALNRGKNENEPTQTEVQGKCRGAMVIPVRT